MQQRSRPIHILAISGSLRQASSNTALLQAAIALAPNHVDIQLYRGLGDLPHFNPDLEAIEPPTVTDLRQQLQWSDGLLISSPEYAHSVPGVLKNALDWLVSGSEFVGKPVALLNASPRATHAQAALIEIITVMSGRLVPEASIAVPLLGQHLSAAAIASHPEFSRSLQTAITAFTNTIQRWNSEGVESI